MSLSWMPSEAETSGCPALDYANWRAGLAAREVLRIGDAMEQMMEGLKKVMHGEGA